MKRSQFLTAFQIAGFGAVVAFGVVAEMRLRDDPTTAWYVFALIAAGVASIGVSVLMSLSHDAETPGRAGALLVEGERADKINDTLLRTSKLIQDYCSHGKAFTHRLEGASQMLSEIKPSHPADDIVLTLIKDNKAMQGKVEALSGKLDESRSRIQDLQHNLRKSEENNSKDSLTNVGNRRFFDECLQIEVHDAHQRSDDLCLAIVDLDHFKTINDKFGHVVGDEILKRFADLLTKRTKVENKVARYGGEEFAVLFPKTRIADAAYILDQVRKELQTKRWVAGHSGKPVGPVTASFGVAVLNAGEGEQSLLRRADAMLYKAKAGGRNRIEVDASAVTLTDELVAV